MNTGKNSFFILLLLSLFLINYGISMANEYFNVEPGWRVGPIIITMTKEDIEHVYGTGEYFVIPDTDKSVSRTMLQYKNIGLNFIFNRNVMEEIEINMPNFKVKDIVGVGSKVAQVEEVLGKNYIIENYQHAYEANLPDYRMIYPGIIFYVKSDRIAKMTVTRQK